MDDLQAGGVTSLPVAEVVTHLSSEGNLNNLEIKHPHWNQYGVNMVEPRFKRMLNDHQVRHPQHNTPKQLRIYEFSPKGQNKHCSRKRRARLLIQNLDLGEVIA